MQYPTGAHFNIDTLRMEMSSFSELVFNPISGEICAYRDVRLCHRRHVCYVHQRTVFAARSQSRVRPAFLRGGFRFGTLAILGTLQLGDSSAYEVAQRQPVKLAAMEGEWQTEPAPAPFHVIALPQQEQERNAFAVKIPALLGIPPRTL